MLGQLYQSDNGLQAISNPAQRKIYFRNFLTRPVILDRRSRKLVQEAKAGLDLGENVSVIPKPKALMWSQKYTGFQNRRVPLVNPRRFGGEGVRLSALIPNV